MMDMVRKHCAEGSGNYKAAQACVDRTHEMLRMFKQATATFVPPRDNLDRVPLGSSSASTYPGYSPADHIYGEAAAEHGAMIAEARRQGKRIEQNPFGIEYVVGQSQGSVNEQMDEWRKSREEIKATKNGPTPVEPEELVNSEPMEGIEQSAKPEQLFMVDSNPTPVNVLQNKSDTSSKAKNRANDKAKRRVSFQDEQPNVPAATDEGHKKKKVKVVEAETVQSYEPEPKPLREEDDISAEVDARLKEKEERRKRKEEKKRKRESEASQADVPEAVVEELAATKPTKKKQKKADEAKEGEQAVESDIAEQVKPNKDKKKKKKRASMDAEPEAIAVTDESEKSKKKRKKESKETIA